MFFFSSKDKAVSILPEGDGRQVLPDPHDIAANRELEMQRFKWNALLSNKPNLFEEDWLWLNRTTPSARDGPIKKKIMQMFNSKVKLKKQVKTLIRSGVPPELRGQVWWACSGAALKMANASPSEQYHFLLSKTNTLEGTQIAADIDKDLLRTFPERINEDTKDTVLMLRRVLMVYALRNAKVGYCQSMNYICALLLFHMEEEKAFWVFASLLEDILPPDYYVPSLLGGRVDQQVFQSCIAWKLPKLFAAFRATNTLLEPIICPWFLCLYINVLPIYAVCRVWDCLFWEGSVVLFRIGLTLIKSKSNQILQATDFIGVYGVLKTNNIKSYSFELESRSDSAVATSLADEAAVSDVELMIKSAFGYRWLRSVPTTKVEMLRQRFSSLLSGGEEGKSGKEVKEPASPTVKPEEEVHTVENMAFKEPSQKPNLKKGRNRKSELMMM
jgi:hypothetical protein